MRNADVLGNPLSYRSVDLCFNYLRRAFFVLAVSLLLSCEGPFADEQSLSGKTN